ncbi:hypothetical protein B0T13DRAFT_510191 [Neurospora crassa]|nr:hypothetical protein B0T13DRAFT_510191 [Neurospora crassa]
MAFRPKMDAAMDEVVDLRPHTAQQADPARKPDMRVDFSTLGNSELASKLPGFLEEMARANRETQELMAADPKAARIEIDDDEEVDTQVIEMNLYSGVLESEEPKKEIVMPNGQPLAGNGAADGDSDTEPFISEPVKVRHTTNNNNRKRRAPSSSSSNSSGSSSSEGETRTIKIPILERKNAREGSLDTQASADSTESSSSLREVSSPKKKITTKECSPSPLVQGQDVQDWVDDQPSMTGDYTEIPGAPPRKMLIPRTRLGAKESQKNVQDWVNDQADQQADE